jgi:hypothetical protein
MVRADYRTIIYKFVGGWSNGVPLWRDSSQKLTLDKKVYQKGDVIKGNIYYECVLEMTDQSTLRNPVEFRRLARSAESLKRLLSAV